MPFKLTPRYIASGLLIIWGAALLGFGLIHSDVYGLDEGAATNLILVWSIVDQIASPVITYGAPDLRALLFIPVGVYWTGSVLAAKIFTAIICFLAALLLYKQARELDNEAAVISTALLLVSPIVVIQIDAIGSGPYLLLCFGLAHVIDQRYRNSGNHFGGWFFIQILIVALSVSLHPMGLAYPAVLIWSWWKEQQNLQAKKSVIISCAITTVLIGAFRFGWPEIQSWLTNPLQVLSDATINGLSGLQGRANIGIGITLFGLLAFILIKDRDQTLRTLSGRSMLLAVLIGMLSADGAWAMVTVSLLLLRGVSLLIRANDSFHSASLLGQRGLVMVGILLVATVFMLSDKGYAKQKALENVAPVDALIRAVCTDAQDTEKPFRAASQWPARTLIACRRDVFPLPRAEATGAQLLTRIEGITHLVFDHSAARNQALANNMSEITSRAETLSLQKAGVVVRIRPAQP